MDLRGQHSQCPLKAGIAGGAAATHCSERTMGLMFLREACLGEGLDFDLAGKGNGHYYLLNIMLGLFPHPPTP